MKTLRHVVAGVFATLLVLLACQAFAQSSMPRAPGAAAPRVDGFDVEQVSQLSPGTQLNFSLFGTPGAQAALRVDGAHAQLMLAEVDAGVYEGSYTIVEQDRITPNSQVTAQLRFQDRVVTSILQEPLLLGTDTAAASSLGQPAIAAGEPGDRAVPYCADCGVVEAIDRSRVSGSGGFIGAIAGGVFGAIVGGQLGHGDGRTAARILGALGGAFAGREIERNSNTRTRYDVMVRLTNGVRRTVAFETAPPFKVGDRVRVAGGTVRPYQ